MPDLVIVDIRGDASSAMAGHRAPPRGGAGAGIFAVALSADPDLILQAMRAGANEFFIWPPADDTFHGAIRRTAARREATQGAQARGDHARVLRRQGRRRHDDGGGQLRRRAGAADQAGATVIVDLKPGLGEVALFLGVRPRYSVLDAIDNLHRLDREFLRELVVKHKSGLEILAGSDHFDRPGAADDGAIEELFRLLTRQYEYLVVDAGSQINSCTVGGALRAPIGCSWSPIPTCRRCATRSGCSSACASWAPAASACACC